MDAVVKCAHARQHDGVCVGHFVRPLCDVHIRANLKQSLVDTAQVSGTVIKQSNHAGKVKREWP